MYGRTRGRSVVMVAAFRRGPCFRSDAMGAGKQCQFGFINVPPSHYAGQVRSVPIGGGLRRVWHWGTLDRCPQVPGRPSRVASKVSEWKGYGALERRRQPCPCCCGGRLCRATRGYSGCGIMEEMVTAWWGPGVMQIDGVRKCGCTCYRPYAGRNEGVAPEKQCPHGLIVRYWQAA